MENDEIKPTHSLQGQGSDASSDAACAEAPPDWGGNRAPAAEAGHAPPPASAAETGGEMAERGTVGGAAAAADSAPRMEERPELAAVGFDDRERNQAALVRRGGDVDGAVEVLLSGAERPAGAAVGDAIDGVAAGEGVAAGAHSAWSRLLVGRPEAEVALEELAAMGFDDRERNQAALVRSFGDIDGAVEVLLSGDTYLNTDAATAPKAAPREAAAVHSRVRCDVTGMFPIVGPRWHMVRHDYDVCDAAFATLPDEEKAKFELIVRPGAEPVPYPDAASEEALGALAVTDFGDRERNQAAFVRSEGDADGAVVVLLSGSDAAELAGAAVEDAGGGVSASGDAAVSASSGDAAVDAYSARDVQSAVVSEESGAHAGRGKEPRVCWTVGPDDIRRSTGQLGAAVGICTPAIGEAGRCVALDVAFGNVHNDNFAIGVFECDEPAGLGEEDPVAPPPMRRHARLVSHCDVTVSTRSPGLVQHIELPTALHVMPGQHLGVLNLSGAFCAVRYRAVTGSEPPLLYGGDCRSSSQFLTGEWCDVNATNNTMCIQWHMENGDSDGGPRRSLVPSGLDVCDAAFAALRDRTKTKIERTGADVASSESEPSPAAAWSRLVEAHPEMEVALVELAAMGFDDLERNQAALVRSRGEIDGAVAVLLSGSDAAEPAGAAVEDAGGGVSANGDAAVSASSAWSRLAQAHPEAEVTLEELVAMGFDDRERIHAALVLSGGAIDGAVAVMLAGGQPTAPTAVEGAVRGGADAGAAATGGDRSEAAKRLLPYGQFGLPAAVELWVERKQSQYDRHEMFKQMRAAAEWALDALCHAHEDKHLKKAVRRLLAVQVFTENLDACPINPEGGPIAIFVGMLRPGLRKRLVKLGATLERTFDDATLASRLSDANVAEAVGAPQEHPLAAARKQSGQGGRPTQTDVLPCVERFVDFTKPETFPDEVYAHAVLMVAAALDAPFQATVARAVSEFNSEWERATGKPGTAKHSAAPAKAIARVITKMRSDYLYDAVPRAQHNVDVVRCLVTADTPEELLTLSGWLVREVFGGVVRLKNLFSASASERASRFHLLPLMLTVQLSAEGGATFESFVRQPEVKAAMAAYAAAWEATLPPNRWHETTTLALAMLESEELSGVAVGLLGELQMVLTEDAKVRHEMHEVYKAYRAESSRLLWEDYARTAMAEGEAEERGLAQDADSLWFAARLGNRPAVETFLKQEGADVNGTLGTGHTPLGEASFFGFTDVVKVLVESRANVNMHNDRNAGGTTPLLGAAQNGHTDIVRMLLDASADVNLASTTTGATPLYMAAGTGHMGVLRMMLDADADVNLARASNGATPLYNAAQEGHTDAVRALLEANADVDKAKTTSGATPVFVASELGHTGVVSVLIDANTNTNQARTSDSSTPMFIASENGHTDVVRALLDSKADANQARSSDGSTPLLKAMERGHTDVVRLLFGARADANLARTDDSATPLQISSELVLADVVRMLIDANVDANLALTDNSTMLIKAAEKGHTDIVRMLFDAGGDANVARTDNGITPLWMAADKGHNDVVRMLIDANADPNKAKTDTGSTPLTMAAEKGHMEVVRVLLDSHADVNLAAANGRTPLFFAASYGHTDVVRMLIDAEADANKARTTDGATPLIMAAQEGHTNVVRMLIGANANVNKATTDDGTTPLYLASGNGHTDVVRMMLDASADADLATTDDGVTPLWMAVQKGDIDVVRMLIDAKADVNKARTTDGATPLCIVANIRFWRYRKHTDIMRMLLDANADANKATTDDGVTPLFGAALNGRTHALRMLIDANADTNLAKTKDGATPLFIASKEGHKDDVSMLLDTGANVNCRLTDGQSCMLVAAQHGHLDVVKMLVDAGADVKPPPVDNPSAIDTGSSGHTPLSAAVAKGHDAIAALLRDAGATEAAVGDADDGAAASGDALVSSDSA